MRQNSVHNNPKNQATTYTKEDEKQLDRLTQDTVELSYPNHSDHLQFYLCVSPSTLFTSTLVMIMNDNLESYAKKQTI